MHKSTSNDSLQIELTPIENKKSYYSRLVSSYLSKKPQIFKNTNFNNAPQNFKNVYLQTKDKNIIGMYVQENQEEVYKSEQYEESEVEEREEECEAEVVEEKDVVCKEEAVCKEDVVCKEEVACEAEAGCREEVEEECNNTANAPDSSLKSVKKSISLIANKITVSAKNFKSFLTKTKKTKNVPKMHKQSANPKKVVIFIHGVSQNRQSFLKLLSVESFDLFNYTLIIPDLRSFGECNFLYNKNGFNTDLERIIEYVNEKYNKPKIVLIGHCIGAGIVLNYCKYAQLNILYEPKVILISPSLNEREIIKKNNILKFYNILKKIDYEKIMNEMINDTLKLIKYKEKNSIIIFHGKKDKVNNIEDGIKIANEIGCRIYRSENDDYFSILKNEEVIRKIDEFTNEQ